jgi:hypothetical protein
VSAVSTGRRGTPANPSRRKHGEVKDDKKALLRLIRSKLNGDHTASELDEPLEYRSRCKTRAVLVATSAIDINGIQVTKLASKLLMKSAGLSLDSLSHWALVTVDRGEGTCYLYDLMSDQMLPTTKIMKNYRTYSQFILGAVLKGPLWSRLLTTMPCSAMFPCHPRNGRVLDRRKLHRGDYTDSPRDPGNR